MREILFRGKREDNGEWVFGMPWILEDRACICPWREGMCKYDTGFYPVRVDPETIGQYTRFSDDHLKRIFEGDICRAKNMLHNGKEELFTVEWYENGFYLIDDTGTPWHLHTLEYIENIGNIHDDPELLGGA